MYFYTMNLTFDNWYRENRIKYIDLSVKELHARYDEETTWVFGLKSAIDIKVFTYLLRLADVHGNINLTPSCRKRLAELLNISMQQITNSLNSLKKEELIKGSRKQYKVLL